MKGLPRSAAAEYEDRLQRTGLATIPLQAGEPTRCRHCSTIAPEHLVRVAGAWSVIDGGAIWDCDSCTRAHLLEIESGADMGERREARAHP